MKEKFQLLKDAEHLTQSRLAEILETQPGNISHILSGRSKPGFELLQKLFQRFPRLNPDWLLLDKGPMYRDAEETHSTGVTASQQEAQPSNARPIPDLASLFESPASANHLSPKSTSVNAPVGTQQSARPHLSITRVVVFYSDQSFESFEPRTPHTSE